MKKLKYILSISLGLLASSCSLEENIYDLATPISVVKTAKDLDNVLVGAYANLNSTPLFGRDIPWALHPYADDLTSVVAFEPGTFGRKSLVNSGNPFINIIYTGFYRMIKDSYGVLDNLDRLELDAAYEEKASGEANFLIAFSYFHLVQLYGGVPLVTGTMDASSDFYIGRNSVDEIYAEVFKKLEASIPGLSTNRTQPVTERYRVTAGAAQGYLAKAYLTYANYLDLNNRSSESAQYYQKAKDNADAVIESGDYSLVSDYGDLYNVDKESQNFQEVIFAIAFTRNASFLSEGSYMPLHFAPGSLPNSTGKDNGRGNGVIKVQPWFFEKYTQGDYVNDYRVEKTFLSSWIDHTGKRHVAYPLPVINTDAKEPQAYLQKYIDGKGVGNNGHENDFVTMRFSDIYLIKAEAENELNGPTTEALEAFNKLRERAREANGTPRTTPENILSSPSKEDFRMQIFDERGLEFVGEFNRFFDLIRMRYKDNVRTMYEYQFGEFLPSLTPGVPKFIAAKWQGGGVTEDNNIIPFDAKYLLWPIPANQMAVNPNLKPNNPQW